MFQFSWPVIDFLSQDNNNNKEMEQACKKDMRWDNQDQSRD